MRRILLACAFALLLALPQGTAASAPESYPADITPLAARWVAQAETFGASSANASWYPEAEAYLAKAKDAAAAGRVRVAAFNAETYTELVRTHRLLDEAQAYRSDAEKKSFILGRTNDWREEANTAWTAYRARLHGYDGELRSLHALEKALYSADMAFSVYVEGERYTEIAREFSKSAGLDRGYVLALTRASSTITLDIAYANDILDAAVAAEGVPPRLLDDKWANITAEATREVPEGSTSPHLATMEQVARPVRANGEGILSVAIAIAEQRTQRANGMETIFGDARSRGKDIVGDAARGMTKQLNNTSVEKARAYGLEGVFTADAIDRAFFARGFVERGEATIATVLVAWSALEHAGYMTNVLAAVSPIEPQTATKQTPAPAPLLAVGVALLAAAALARRR